MLQMSCTMECVDPRYKFNAELYHALMIGEDDNKVMELCRKVPDHALHILTIHDDTVLHMANYSKKSELVLHLLDELPDHCLDKMTRQNKAGNTILHETATSNHARRVAETVLKKAPGLLGMRNNNGETALFYAARYGKAEIFHCLAGKISGYDQVSKQLFLQRSAEKTTALHISILFQHYELALDIAKDYQYLVGEQDADGMTALQLLSYEPEAFKRKREGRVVSKLINYVKFSCISTWRDKIKREEQHYKSAIELAMLLIKRDTSWELTCPIQEVNRPLIHKYGASPHVSSFDKGITEGHSTGYGGHGGADIDTPLFLATKSGCLHIVKEILEVYPQAIGYINHDGRNILHVAIKYRQLQIFEFLKEMELTKRNLARKIDNKGNTILHMVGTTSSRYAPEKVEGPALLLQDELLWFERVKGVMETHFLSHQNDQKLTAEAQFARKHNDLRLSSKEWLKHTAEGCSVVSVLIATVAFAAAYTVPGGPNQSTGFPVLVNDPFFMIFTISDVFSLTFSLASVVIFLSILTSPFTFQDFTYSLITRMILGFAFMFLSVCMMMIAFAATILLMIKNKESWAKVMLYTLSFIPVGVFAISYFPLYIATSITRGCKHYFENRKLKLIIPQKILALLKKITCLSEGPQARPTNSYIP